MILAWNWLNHENHNKGELHAFSRNMDYREGHPIYDSHDKKILLRENLGIFSNPRIHSKYDFWDFLSENGKLGLKLKIWKCLGIEPIHKYGSNIPGIYVDNYFRFLAHHVIDELIDEINDEPVKI